MEVNCVVVDAKGARDAREAEAHRPLLTRGLGVGRYRLLWGWLALGKVPEGHTEEAEGGSLGGSW